nr:KpsF/GutQ family sugar-phosphate isomerase [Verrucomicrobiaceae bacterium]
QHDELAVNVVKIIRDTRIDDVIVTDDKQKVVGLVDVQDLSNFDFA